MDAADKDAQYDALYKVCSQKRRTLDPILLLFLQEILILQHYNHNQGFTWKVVALKIY